MKRSLVFILIILAGLFILSSSVFTDNLHKEIKNIDAGEAKMVKVDLTMGAGELTVKGGADELLDAEFIYNRPEWKPEVDYRVSYGVGRLSLSQPSGTAFNSVINLGNAYYEWNIQLNNDIPMEMDVELGAGKATLHLGELSISRLDIKLGVGDVVVDLAGNLKDDLKASIIGGVGQTLVKVPSDVGVKVDVVKGIGSVEVSGLKRRNGSYINEIYGSSEVNLLLSIKAGIGEIRIEAIN